jgi:hypothetical protein
MTKKTTTKTAARSRNTKPNTSRKSSPRTAPSDTKQEHLLAMLRNKSGVTVPAMMQATGWQEHTVRSFLSAVVRKRLGLNLVREKKEGGDSVYRVVPAKSARGRKAKA